ncbi:hypothetical protein Tco_0788835 [Tanacetum coccineum]
MFIKYSTGHIPPKKSIGKGLQGKKTTHTLMTDVNVSEESEPEPTRKKTSSKRRFKKKVTISVDDNIITEDPDVALELGKSISRTEAGKEGAARQVYATYKRIMIESVPKPTRRRQSGKLLKSRKTSRRQPGTRGSSEGTGTILGILDESTVVSTTSSEGTSAKPGVPDEENVVPVEDDKDDDADDEGDDYISDNQDSNDEDDDDEDPYAGPNQGKKTKRRRTKDSENFKKPSTIKNPKVEEPTTEVVMDDAGKDVPLILVLVHQPIRNERIAKVELAVYGVGQGGKVMGLFWGAKVEVRDKDDE